ncbi:glycosyltransferase family 4 protein [Photobacterium iliopiscarium]|uniref:glycosyltransferase family 4 protein n=1 Tax=Photobacterium iliopiscarium TaxID=56192 RepID=UPI00242A3911|nr:glycosyltransferase family 4 protein [Photobacterium iliopiscarium]
MKKPKILVVIEYIGENGNSTAYYWSQIIKKLNINYHVVLISPENKESLKFSKLYNVDSRLVKVGEHNKNSLISRLLGQIKQTKAFIYEIKKEVNNCQLVFTGTNPIVTMVFLSFFKKIKKFKWLVLVHDIFPNNLVPAGFIKKGSLLYKILNYFSFLLYSSPDRLISIGRDMTLLLEEKIKKGNVVFIPNWASTDKNKPENKNKNEIILNLGWEDYIVFQFFGNMGRLQGLPNLMKAIKSVNNEKARFLFIGSGSEASYIKTIIKEINIECNYEKAFFYGYLDLNKNNMGLNACDVSFVSLAEKMYGLGVPSKAYFSMAVGKPLLYIGDENSELDILLSEYDIGWKCKPGYSDKLALLIDNITDEYICSSMNKNPRKLLIDNFSEDIILGRIEDVVISTI